MSDDAILLKAHESRLQRVEDGFLSLTTQLLPAVARLEAGLTGMREDVGDLKSGVAELQAGQTKLDGRVRDVETTDAAAKASAGDRKKWVMGIIGGVVTAALLMLLGLQ